MSKPLIIDQGQVRQLPIDEPLAVGSWQLPAGSPNANSLLICTQQGQVAWIGTGADQFLATDADGDLGAYDKPEVLDWPAALFPDATLITNGSGDVAWASQPWAWGMATPTANNQVYQATGAGEASWTTDLQGLTSLQVDDITIDGNSIVKTDSDPMYFRSDVVAGGDSYAVYFIANVEAARAYGSYHACNLKPASGNQARGRQTVVTADTNSGNLGWLIGEYMDLAKSGSNTIAGAAAYYIPTISEATNNWAIYCFNDITIAADGRALTMGSSRDAGLWYDGSANIWHFDANYAGLSGGIAQFDTDVSIPANLVVNFGQYSVGEEAANRLRVTADRTDGAGMIVDWYPRPEDGANGTDYLLHYLWADNTANYEILRYGYQPSGTDRYVFETIVAGTGTHHPIQFSVAGYTNLWLQNDGSVGCGTSAVDAYTQLDVRHTLYQAGTYANQLHLHTTNNTYGMYMGSWSTDYGYITQGGYYWSSGQIMPRSTKVAGMRFNDGYIQFMVDTGLTSGTAYAPSTQFTIAEQYCQFAKNVEVRQSTSGTESAHHVFGYDHGTGVTGTMKIRLPFNWSNVMQSYRILGYNYSNSYNGAEGPWELVVGGYDYSGNSSWYAQGCGVTGNPPFRKVRVAHDGTGVCLLLGKEATVWNYPHFQVMDLMTRDDYSVWGKTGWDVDFSTNESADWTITKEEPCPLFIGPGVEIEDDGGTGVNLLVNNINVTDNIQIGGSDTCRVLGADKTIYVRTTGSNSNGGTSVADAFLTPQRAIDELYRWVADGYNITVDFGAGHYAVPSALKPTYAYGANVTWQGVSEQHTGGCAVSSIGADTASTSGLSYIQFDITLPLGYSASAGDFILVKSATGGTNSHLVMGCHEVTAYDSGTRKATVRCFRRASVSALPSGSISITNMVVVKTVLSFNNGNGIYFNGAYHAGSWDKMVVKGNLSGRGVWVLGGASIALGSHFGTSTWQENVYAQNNANVFGDYSLHSHSNSAVVKAQNGGVVNLRYGAVLTGARNYGIQCFLGATVAAYQCYIYTAGATAGVYCYQGGFVDVSSGHVKDGHVAATGLRAERGGGIDGTSTTNNYTNTESTATSGYII